MKCVAIASALSIPLLSLDICLFCYMNGFVKGGSEDAVRTFCYSQLLEKPVDVDLDVIKWRFLLILGTAFWVIWQF